MYNFSQHGKYTEALANIFAHWVIGLRMQSSETRHCSLGFFFFISAIKQMVLSKGCVTPNPVCTGQGLRPKVRGAISQIGY